MLPGSPQRQSIPASIILLPPIPQNIISFMVFKIEGLQFFSISFWCYNKKQALFVTFKCLCFLPANLDSLSTSSLPAQAQFQKAVCPSASSLEMFGAHHQPLLNKVKETTEIHSPISATWNPEFEIRVLPLLKYNRATLDLELQFKHI